MYLFSSLAGGELLRGRAASAGLTRVGSATREKGLLEAYMSRRDTQPELVLTLIFFLHLFPFSHLRPRAKVCRYVCSSRANVRKCVLGEERRGDDHTCRKLRVLGQQASKQADRQRWVGEGEGEGDDERSSQPWCWTRSSWLRDGP